ncbi:eukaryotic translation initiation factor 2-alpha kinase 3-like isoform X1 [Mytilus californianus]|uniref:eukaryotic translation initiation factor 2-alpha kinase 3-like isoform X1 n=2 Tax=Mytilus californianus TaxID=6549 RepID=UPI002245D168|nr:eukaryotic translation initiation factor 2-alpha kinase 3-like isoform X1 [Mytilus californianus]
MGRRRSKRWNSCMIWFATSVGALFYTISCIKAADDIDTLRSADSGTYYDFPREPEITGQRSSCVAKPPSVLNKFLMVVSTLDGKVSALDVQDSGKILWSVDADTRPLLSSSIGNLEITRNGMKTRLIPSLDGGLYQFDGESIEAVPLSAETLLSSSFKMTEDITMIGGKDLLSYGLDPLSGQLKYTCSAHGCHTFGDSMVTEEEDVLVVTRNTQTVRAVDSRVGMEKWNFSVGSHDLEFLPGTNIKPVKPVDTDYDDDVKIVTCPANEEEEIEVEPLLKIVVPEGLVVGLSSDNIEVISWKHKFTSPVANAWLLRNGILKPISVFDNQHVPAMSSFEPPQNAPSPEPLLYVGKHQNQLYVQPSVAMKEKMAKVVHGDYPTRNVPRVTWKPYLASAPSRTPMMKNKEVPLLEEGQTKETGMVLYNYPFDDGYYLYPEFMFSVPEDRPENNSTDEPDMLVNITQSFWSYWKEVLVFSMFFAVFVHLFLTKVAVKQGLIVIKKPNCLEDVNGNSKDVVEKKTEEFVSRYTSDFDHVQVLGKGGFGIVFESRNKVDDCDYAVKRITLHSEGSKEKVMREVKALAKLEHSGIVRYFNAWLESPPPGWQEDQDKQFEDSECLTSPTPCNSVTQIGTGSLSIKMPPSPAFDILNPFGGQKDIDTVFAKSKKAGGSQEFSVHTDSISFSREGSVRQESMLEGFDETWNEDSLDVQFKLDESDDSGSCSNNIPFSNANKKRNDNSNSFSVVFEDSGCAEKSSKSDSGEIIFSNDFTESNKILFENNDFHIDISKSGSTLPKVSNSSKKHSTRDQNTTSGYKMKVPTPKLYLFIQMQLCRRETLKDWLISNNSERDNSVVLDIFDQIMGAVEYVHNQGLMHRDLKPSNIFFSVDGVIKIGDFGLVTALEDQELELYLGEDSPYKRHTAQVGTQMYMSPEQINGKTYGHKVDIFSLGMILFELFYCFSTQMERVKILLDVKRQRFSDSFKMEYPLETMYISWLLSPNPVERPSATEILNSDLLKDFSSRHTTSRNRLRTTSSSSSGSINESVSQ